MKLGLRKKREVDPLQETRLSNILDELNHSTDSSDYDALFIKLMSWIKTAQSKSTILRIDHLISLLKSNEADRRNVQKLILHLFQSKDFRSLFTDIGLLNSPSFFSEISKSISNKILPNLRSNENMKDLLEISLNQSKGYSQILDVPNKLWIELFQLIGHDIDIASTSIYDQILDAISILSFRILTFAYEDNVSQKWKASQAQFNELLNQNQEINWLVHMYKEGRFDDHAIEEQFTKINDSLNTCKTLIADIKHNSVLYGTSLEQSYSIAKTEQQLNRIKNLLVLLKINSKPEQMLNVVVVIFNRLVENINKEKKLSHVFSQSVGLLAYQVSEHKRETGEHYITASRSEYWTLFWSSIKGGLIVCIAALIKILLHYVHIPMFWTYFLYGLNYALAFCIMYLAHATLATKQPAMTAAALADAMDVKNQHSSSGQMSITLARVWRSQFISFVGNLIIVFPICIAIGMFWNFITYEHLMQPMEYAGYGLTSQHPLKSLALFYACITGVFLFLSGIISGYVDNKVVFGNIPARINAHPYLNKVFSKYRLNALSGFVRKHLGAIVGNIFLGFALGYAPFIGELFGLPFDIRHITISTAYLGFGIVGTEFSWPLMEYLLVAVGVIGIGALNFTVSFGLAFMTAMSSRNIPLKNVKYYFRTVRKHFFKFPLDFIYPPKKAREPEDIL